MVKVTNEQELAEALKSDEDTIEIEGDLSKKAFKIKATGKVAWAVAIGAIGVAVVAVLAAPGTAGTSTIASAADIGAAATSLGGMGVAISAVTMAVAAGGVGVLNKLRSYRLEKISDSKVILHKK